MGRKPNALILEFFERGPKLADNSNRYPHTCKACGENFPKGRIDSLTNHLTKKCPAISEADRINACLTLHGINHASPRNAKNQQVPPTGPAVDLPMIQRDWTALETLAEVSRQIDLSEKHDDRAPAGTPAANGTASQAAQAQPGGDRFEVQEHFTLDNPPSNHDGRQPRESKGSEQKSSPILDKDLTTEEKLRILLSSSGASEATANITMAAAAAARLNPSLLDPQLLDEDVAAAVLPSIENSPPSGNLAVHANSHVSQPWGEITYLAETVPEQRVGLLYPPGVSPLMKGGFKMDTGDGSLGGRSRHSRARFDATRRKEVQEVRKIGACIRCRILRKTCSKGSPCDACKKVLSPRIWRSGCVRTKFTEQLDLYAAGVQIVLAQHRINSLKAALTLGNLGVVVEASLFPDLPVSISLPALQRTEDSAAAAQIDPSLDKDKLEAVPVVMIDNETQDIPNKLEAYMRQVLPEIVRQEVSHFMRTTLQTALEFVEQSPEKTPDPLLVKSIELWGLVEILDRERQWYLNIKPESPDGERKWIKEDTDGETFTTICLQLTAASERKAAATSKSLLTGMQRLLQDSKTKVDYSIFFTTIILLNCVEKWTWAFKAWEQATLRPLWPLEKEPGSFTQQGYVISDLLRMLLGIRKALPTTFCRESDGMLSTEDEDPAIRKYFEAINLNVAQVKAKQQHPVFSPTDPRSFELLFVSTLLLPGQD